eukprot:TRINITY_DN32418_c0_g1_i1.p1 TRINITY_DN32418_c0_g1~~TRINITY_DN32418_c0_g1_i1.p1  ORF type:complete len:132 (-),score=7.24 TRINITY_DN32418_c0_g1_i1:19-414(-)
MANVNKTIPAKKKNKDSVFNRINKWLHLWLGLISGVIVLIVCITGCIWVFNEEITGLLEPETKIEKQDKPVITPSQLSAIAFKLYPDKIPSYAQYQQGRAISLNLRGKKRGRQKRRRNEPQNQSLYRRSNQ